MAREKLVKLDYDIYISERRELAKYQQAAYDSYEKTITALTGSTLALSVAFLGFLQSSRPHQGPLIVRGSESWIYLSWLTLTLGLVSLLACFFVNAHAFTQEIKVLQRSVEDGSVLNEKNWWANVSIGLYAISAGLFIGGVLSLLYFCHLNLVL